MAAFHQILPCSLRVNTACKSLETHLKNLLRCEPREGLHKHGCKAARQLAVAVCCKPHPPITVHLCMDPHLQDKHLVTRFACNWGSVSLKWQPMKDAEPASAVPD